MLLQDRIPTHHNLFSRRIIVDLGGISCVFFNEIVELVCHFFVRCPFLGQIWYHVFKWMGWELVLPSDIASLLSFMFDLGGGKKESLGFLLIWQSVA